MCISTICSDRHYGCYIGSEIPNQNYNPDTLCYGNVYIVSFLYGSFLVMGLFRCDIYNSENIV